MEATLYELSLAEQEARNSAALAAIQARRADIEELQQFANALNARGLSVRPAISTHPIGDSAICRLQLWASCTLQELGVAVDWMASNQVTADRLFTRDQPGLRVYHLTLRGMTVSLNAQIRAPARNAVNHFPARVPA